MSANSYSWIMIAFLLLLTLFYLAMLVYACMAKSDGSGAKRLAVIGIALTLICRTTAWIIPVLASRYSRDSLFLIQAISQVIFGVVQCTAMALIVAAVFKGRHPAILLKDSESSVEGLPKNDPNPYASPST